MRQETKDLLNGIKLVLLSWEKENPHDKDITSRGIAFLRSLPELEKQLQCGGFIADRHGFPCKDGDKVRVCYHDSYSDIVTLRWNKHLRRFVCVASDGCNIPLGAFDIERIEEISA